MKESQARYKKYYGVDCFCEECYDLVINTTNLKIDQVVDKIITELKIWKNKQKPRRRKRLKKS